jgi:hypothetical protein
VNHEIHVFFYLFQIPESHMVKYIQQVLGVILALLEDPTESVQLTAVQCLLTVLNLSEQDAVDPILINLLIRLRNLQVSMNTKMRSNAFAAYGALSAYGVGLQRTAFIEQIHATLPRLILHLHDDDLSVRLACRNTFQLLAPLMEVDGLSLLLSKQYFTSDRRFVLSFRSYLFCDFAFYLKVSFPVNFFPQFRL